MNDKYIKAAQCADLLTSDLRALYRDASPLELIVLEPLLASAVNMSRLLKLLDKHESHCTATQTYIEYRATL